MTKPRIVIIDDVGFKDTWYGEGLWGKPYIRWWLIRCIRMEREMHESHSFKIIIVSWFGGKSISVFPSEYTEVITELQLRGKL